MITNHALDACKPADNMAYIVEWVNRRMEEEVRNGSTIIDYGFTPISTGYQRQQFVGWIKYQTVTTKEDAS